MKVEPGARALLEAARTALVNEVVPSLPPDRRYAALMAANALAISMRALDAPDTGPEELARIASLLDDPGCGPLERANRTLASRIRAGAFDAGAPREALLAHLRQSTRERLAVSNPKALRTSPEKP